MSTDPESGRPASLNRLAFSATVHCLTGCSIGEVLGMVLGTAGELSGGTTIALSICLAFLFGYLLTMLPLLRSGLTLGTSLGLAFASDTASITVMEIVDNALMLVIPGAMDAGLGESRFWGSLALSLLIAGVAAFPVTRWLMSRGRGHAYHAGGIHVRSPGHRPGADATRSHSPAHHPTGHRPPAGDPQPS
jgi:hypothetical protein